MQPTGKNPYRSPRDHKLSSSNKKVDWKSLALLNIATAGILATLILSSFLWNQYERAARQEVLGRRYAVYDVEHNFNVGNGLIMLAVVFAVANVVFFAVHFSQRLSERE
ncbi:MAG: hypothetical protein ACI87E_002093 [Mariniblastus sp.]|jgi:hypothetical protein